MGTQIPHGQNGTVIRGQWFREHFLVDHLPVLGRTNENGFDLARGDLSLPKGWA